MSTIALLKDSRACPLNERKFVSASRNNQKMCSISGIWLIWVRLRRAVLNYPSRPVTALRFIAGENDYFHFSIVSYALFYRLDVEAKYRVAYESNGCEDITRSVPLTRIASVCQDVAEITLMVPVGALSTVSICLDAGANGYRFSQVQAFWKLTDWNGDRKTWSALIAIDWRDRLIAAKNRHPAH